MLHSQALLVEGDVERPNHSGASDARMHLRRSGHRVYRQELEVREELACLDWTVEQSYRPWEERIELEVCQPEHFSHKTDFRHTLHARSLVILFFAL